MEITFLNWSYLYINKDYILYFFIFLYSLNSLFAYDNIMCFSCPWTPILCFQLELDQFNMVCAQICFGFYPSPYFLFGASKWSVWLLIPELFWGIKNKLTCMHNSLASPLVIQFCLLAEQYRINNCVFYSRIKLISAAAHQA